MRWLPLLLYLPVAGCYASTAPGDAEGGAAPTPVGTVLYLAFNGGAYDFARTDDATRNRTVLAGEGPIDAVPFAHDRGVGGGRTSRAQVVGAIADLVRAQYASFDVRVVTERPASGAYSTIAVGGTMDDISHMGRCTGGGVDMAAGLAPIDCDDGAHRDVGFVATDCLPESSPSVFRQLTAVAIAHEAGHLFGLEHVEAGSGSLMEVGASELAWGRGPVSMPECGRSVQGDRALLRDNVGLAVARPAVPPPPDREPPALRVRPGDGTRVPDGFVPCVTAEDPAGLQLVVLQVFEPDASGEPVLIAQHTRREPPFDFPVVQPKSNRPLTLRVTATDRWDNLAERRVEVSLDPTASPVAACD